MSSLSNLWYNHQSKGELKLYSIPVKWPKPYITFRTYSPRASFFMKQLPQIVDCLRVPAIICDDLPPSLLMIYVNFRGYHKDYNTVWPFFLLKRRNKQLAQHTVCYIQGNDVGTKGSVQKERTPSHCILVKWQKSVRKLMWRAFERWGNWQMHLLSYEIT